MKIGFLGAGHMGRAIIDGLLNTYSYQKQDFKIVVARDRSMQNYQKENFFVSKDWSNLAECKIVILALRPDAIKEMEEQLKQRLNKKQIIISVAAGVTLAKLRKIFPNAAVTRVMPNISCAHNQSMTMICKEGKQEANEKAIAIFNLLGQTVLLNEDKIHVFIAICGSASAYLYYWMQPLMQLALTNNISIADSKNIIANLLIGAATNIFHSKATLSELQQQVSVPNGTTVEAIKVFDQHDLKQVITKAIKAVEKRSQELE